MAGGASSSVYHPRESQLGDVPILAGVGVEKCAGNRTWVTFDIPHVSFSKNAKVVEEPLTDPMEVCRLQVLGIDQRLY